MAELIFATSVAMLGVPDVVGMRDVRDATGTEMEERPFVRSVTLGTETDSPLVGRDTPGLVRPGTDGRVTDGMEALGELVGRLVRVGSVMMLPSASVVREGVGTPRAVGVTANELGTKPALEAELRIESKEDVIPVGITPRTALGSAPFKVTGLAEDLAASAATAMMTVRNILIVIAAHLCWTKRFLWSLMLI